MKKYISLIAIAGLALTACQKEVNPDSSNGISGNGELRTYVFDGTDALTKMAVGSYSASGTPAKWETNDAINVCKVSDGSSVGTATVETAGNRFGQFTVSTTASAGTAVRVLYPSTATYGQGNLPAAQSIKSNSAGTLNYSHAYSDEIILPEEGNVNFGLKHALATVRVTCKADPEGEFNWPSATQGYVNYVRIRTIDSPLSGDYTVDYSTGAVTPGANTDDYVEVSRGAGFNTGGTAVTYCTTLPTNGVKQIEVLLTISHQGSTWTVPVLFKGEIKAGQLNVFDLGAVSLKKEYLSTSKDYYAQWLSGQDIKIGDKIINKTTFPTAQLLKSSKITSSTLSNGGLIFVDDKTDTIAIDNVLNKNQKEVAKTAECVLIGRWKDAGTQPVLKITEMRVNVYDFSMLNMKLICMRTGSGSTGSAHVFGKQKDAANDTGLRLMDCYIDARNPTDVVGLMSETTYKGYTTVLFDNCIVDLPVNAGATTPTVLNTSFFSQSVADNDDTADKDIIVKNCVLFTSGAKAYENVKYDRMKVNLIFLSSKTLSKTSITFDHNTITNFQNNYGYCYFKQSTVKSFTYTYNLGYLESPIVDAGNTFMLRNDSASPGNTFINDPVIDYNFTSRNSTSTETTEFKVNRTNTYGHVFVTGYGTHNIDAGTKASTKTPFTEYDMTTGHFVVDASKVTNGAGARTEKKFITPTLK